MGFDEILRSYQPLQNEDEKGFDVLTGKYKCKANFLRRDFPKGDDLKLKPRYRLELQVTENVEGDRGVGRRFWKAYALGNEEKMKALLNDLFTAGISLPNSSENDFEMSLPLVKDATFYVRAWGFPPEKRRDGSQNTGDGKEMQQAFVIYNPAKQKSAKPAADKVPF